MAKRSNKQLKAVQATKARKKRRNRRKKRAIILIVEIIILLMLSGTAYVMAKYDKFQKVEINSDDIKINEGVKMEGYTTMALFGGDSREGQLEAGTHADTIIIAVMDHDKKEIRMASVYRDTLLEQEDGSYNKANYAYFSGGPVDAINMLNKNLDLNIEDYATVAYNLDGPQAVTYARLRKLEGGDYKRTERQRLVIQKIFEKAVKMDVGTLNKLVDTVFPQVSTSFTLKEIVNLGSAGITYKLSDSTGFPFDRDDSKRYKGTSVVVAQGLAENVQQLHEFLYPGEETYVVSDTIQSISDDIMNTTGVVRPKELDEEPSEEVTSGVPTSGEYDSEEQ